MLLDLSRRNRLLNFREGPAAVRLSIPDPSSVEDALADGRVHRILELPQLPQGALATERDPSFFAKEAASGRIYAASAAGDSRKRVLSICRAGRTDLEEGGARTVFLALGVLKWKDGTGAKAPTYRAPLILCPVDLAKLPGKDGFSLRRADEDSVTNTTLLEMLRREHHVEVQGVDPLPEDEHGVDVPAVMEAWRKAVAPLDGWSVESEVWLGRFSFGKFLMWRDLTERADDLAKSPIVAHLIAGGGAFDDGVPAVEPSQTDALTDAKWPPCPVAADSSQLSAVLAAVNGRSFVLHGPPGTGKSQTITNLIACCMAAGKSVLFVAEKRAALDVVHRRLKKVGLSPFCLELHSNKAGKTDVLRQFSEALEYAGSKPPEAWDATLDDLRASRRALDAYVEALHAQSPCGLTPYRAFSYLLSHGADEAAAAGMAPLENPPFGDEGAYEGAARLAQNLAEAARDVPPDAFEALAPIGARQWTPGWSDRLLAAARPLVQVSESLLSAVADFDPAATWQQIETRLRARERGLAAVAEFERQWPALDPEKAASLDVKALRAALDDIPNRFFLLRPLRRRAIRKAICTAARPVVSPKIPSDALAGLVDRLATLRADLSDASALPSSDAAHRLVQAWETWRGPAAKFAVVAAGAEGDSSAGSTASAGASEHAAAEPAAVLAAARTALDRPGDLRPWCRFRAAEAACAEAGLEPLAKAVESGAVAPDDAESATRKRWCEAFARRALDASEPLRSFFGGGQDSMVARFCARDKDMAKLSRDMVLARLSLALVKARKSRDLAPRFAMLAHEVAKKTRQKPPRALLEALGGALPALKPCLLMSPLSVAQYLPPGGRTFDVIVFDEASQLTVPDAIGALARGRQAVIVGDPKQLPPTSFFQKGADSAEEQDVAQDEEEAEDLDSILDECKAAGVPEQALLWHYRSRHESLISFSNQRYYDGKLFTFPSAAAAGKGLGVSRVKVEGGTFDRAGTRTNRKEAEAVAAAVVERMLDPSFANKTCGVVTFSQAQQSLIEDLLDDAQAAHPEIQRFFDPALPEPFFVKNLENVQGDERDAIYFSVGYAPDPSGTFAMNFGPLNRPGGERRLNVAVTRAKEQIVVFTSIEHTQIDLSRTAALGAAHLREFLAYAAGGAGSAPDSAKATAASGGAPRRDLFASEVADFLRTSGYEVDENVGCSGYKVDLAVRAPDGVSHILAVECDGAMYRDAASARDRDESRRGVLEGLGWHVARCWCMEWWFDREKAEAKLLSAVDAAISGGKAEAAPTPVPSVSATDGGTTAPAPDAPTSSSSEGASLAAELEEAATAPDENVRPYVPAPCDRSFAKAPSNFNATYGLQYVQAQMSRIVKDEGPITEELLFARVLEEWDMKQATDNRLKVLRKAVPKALRTTVHLKRRTYWPAGVEPEQWRTCRIPTGSDTRARRTFVQIPFEEFAAAFDSLTRTDPATVAAGNADALFRAALSLFGLPPRLTPDIRQFLEAARRASLALGREDA